MRPIWMGNFRSKSTYIKRYFNYSLDEMITGSVSEFENLYKISKQLWEIQYESK